MKKLKFRESAKRGLLAVGVSAFCAALTIGLVVGTLGAAVCL